MDAYEITVAFDDEAQSWYAQNDDIPIILEDVSLDRLLARVKAAAPEMLELNAMPYERFPLANEARRRKKSLFRMFPPAP
jgi:hypothetical protein